MSTIACSIQVTNCLNELIFVAFCTGGTPLGTSYEILHITNNNANSTFNLMLNIYNNSSSPNNPSNTSVTINNPSGTSTNNVYLPSGPWCISLAGINWGVIPNPSTANIFNVTFAVGNNPPLPPYSSPCYQIGIPPTPLTGVVFVLPPPGPISITV